MVCLDKFEILKNSPINVEFSDYYKINTLMNEVERIQNLWESNESIHLPEQTKSSK